MAAGPTSKRKYAREGEEHEREDRLVSGFRGLFLGRLPPASRRPIASATPCPRPPVRGRIGTQREKVRRILRRLGCERGNFPVNSASVRFYWDKIGEND